VQEKVNQRDPAPCSGKMGGRKGASAARAYLLGTRTPGRGVDTIVSNIRKGNRALKQDPKRRKGDKMTHD